MDCKILVGFVGIVLVLLAITSSLGLYSYFRLEATFIILMVVPFVVLAVGFDNLFILIHSYEVCMCVCVHVCVSVCVVKKTNMDS